MTSPTTAVNRRWRSAAKNLCVVHRALCSPRGAALVWRRFPLPSPAEPRLANHARNRLRHRNHRPRPGTGDRIVEIGCIELFNHIPTGKSFHRYLNPERPMSIDAARVHGLDDAFLKDKPLFADDRRRVPRIPRRGQPDRPQRRLRRGLRQRRVGPRRPRAARQRPRHRHADAGAAEASGQPRLARRADGALPDRRQPRRTLHGALLDAELLSEVYIELIGGRQAALILGGEPEAPTIDRRPRRRVIIGARPMPRVFNVTPEEIAAHRAAIERLGAKAIWREYGVAA